MHLQLPKRVKEILEELGFIELQCYKPNPLMKQQPSLLFPRDEDKNTFLHLLGTVFPVLKVVKFFTTIIIVKLKRYHKTTAPSERCSFVVVAEKMTLISIGKT